MEPDGFYVVLSKIRSESRKWHWGLHLVFNNIDGRTFHIVDRNEQWFYESNPTARIRFSESVVIALQIASIERDMHLAFFDRINAITPFEGNTCRTWVLEVLKQLDDEGWISLISPVGMVEEEAIEAAETNQYFNIRSAKKSILCRR